MDTIHWVLGLIDPVLIGPYRWFQNPMLGWWTGTFVLSLWAVLLGEASVAIAMRVNRHQIEQNSRQTLYYHKQSMTAKKAGDEEAYKGINKLANEAFGKSFFLMMATGMASLWPAFFAAAWLHLRFNELAFEIPGWPGGFKLTYLTPFILLYLFSRLILGRIKSVMKSTFFTGVDDDD